MKAYTDGARRKTVGAFSFLVYKDDGSVYHAEAKSLQYGTNNEFEYRGLIALLLWANDSEVKHLQIFSDSQLVVEQVNGTFKINKPHLQKLQTQAYGLLVRGGHTLKHIKGHEGHEGNEEADRLCNEAMDRYENTLKGQVMDHA